MGTHDEETEDFFVGSAVQVIKVMRVREGGGAGMVENKLVETV